MTGNESAREHFSHHGDGRGEHGDAAGLGDDPDPLKSGAA
jgi:hypothetical protein